LISPAHDMAARAREAFGPFALWKYCSAAKGTKAFSIRCACGR
jgi:hypothetical protein